MYNQVQAYSSGPSIILNESFLFYPCSQKKIYDFYVILMILSKEMELKSLLYFKSKELMFP